MNVQGLDGRTYRLKLSSIKGENKSGPHLRARGLLAALFPMDSRIEEIHVPGPDSLFLDFFLPGRSLVVEVHGSQHFEFKAHFHGNKLGFLQSQKRDGRKREWCELNNLRLVELRDDENDDEWKRRIFGWDEREGMSEEGGA